MMWAYQDTSSTPPISFIWHRRRRRTGEQEAAGTNSGDNGGDGAKLGMTISRVPLGLYVISVSIDFEAYAVGISHGSVLIDVNRSLGMLLEVR